MPNQFPRETSNRDLASYYMRLQISAQVPHTVSLSTILASACNAYLEGVRLSKPSLKRCEDKIIC